MRSWTCGGGCTARWIAGVSREDVDVELEGDLLTISGERKASEAEGFFRRERPCGAFKRSLSLPRVSEQNLSATLKDGVLTVRVSLTDAPTPQPPP